MTNAEKYKEVFGGVLWAFARLTEIYPSDD